MPISQDRSRKLVLIAAFFSILLYLAGVFSGIYANKIFEKKTDSKLLTIRNEAQAEVVSLKKDTLAEFQSIKGNVTFFEKGLKDIQLEQSFVDTLNGSQKCNFLNISLGYRFRELKYYWSVLPFRLEEYERSNNLSDEYLALKDEYGSLILRTWLLAKSERDLCGARLIHGLYLYSANCTECVSQGEELDSFSELNAKNGIDTIMFPVDFYSRESFVRFLKDYYRINSTPALLLNDHVYQGHLFTASELVGYENET